MTTRTGKIARLPLRLRNRLNFFLMDGKPASLILDWINVEPEAIEVFNSLFGGRPASPQNLSERRQGGYREWLATRECLMDADSFCENSQMLGISGIRADHILVFLTARWAKLIQQWGVMDPTQFSFAKHNLADLTKSAALIKKLELQSMRAEMDRERLKFLLKKMGGQSGASDHSHSDAEPRYSPFHHEPPAYGEKGRIVGAVSVPEARDALQRLEEHPGALEPETAETTGSQPRNSERHPSAPPQTSENGNTAPTPRQVSSPQPERHNNPVPRAASTANSPGAAILSRNEASASSCAQQTV